jgi:uncharacterized protein (TIGR00645 family)|tara:strand:- start:310 stop:831 length:522 start_codon:yes stop_codon:yes gene_type:complete
MKDQIEELIERGIFASRWFLAPIYLVLSISLLFISIKTIQELFHFVPSALDMEIKDMMLYILHIVDLALIANLVLMIIFAGYENFVSKIGVANDSEDKPSWMGQVGFSELKLKLIASIVAISGINLLEAFMDLSLITDRDLRWMIIVHITFIVSGVLLALMDFLASKAEKHGP